MTGSLFSMMKHNCIPYLTTNLPNFALGVLDSFDTDVGCSSLEASENVACLWSGNFFLIASCPDHCLFVLFSQPVTSKFCIYQSFSLITWYVFPHVCFIAYLKFKML